MKRVYSLLALLLVVSLVLAACGGAQPTAAPTTAPAEEPTTAPAEEPTAAPSDGAKGTIKIATQSPLSGPQSVLGVAIKNGAQLALEQLGGSLKDMGFDVQLVPYDDQATPDTGVANAKNIVADSDILCVVGHLNSGVAIPSSEEYHAAQLAMVSPANTNPNITDREYAEVNRIVGRDDVQGVVGEQFALNELEAKSVYILHDKTAYGQGVAEFFRQAAEKDGIEVLGFEGTEETANFDSIITPILVANPDVLYFGGLYPQAGVLFKQAREKGVKSTFMGPDGMDSSELVNLGGESVVGMYYSTVAGPASVYPATAQFIEDYKARFNANSEPFSAQAYDSMGICLQAIQTAAAAAGDAKPARADVAAAVRATAGYKGITGDLSFNEKGDLASAKYFVIQVKSADPNAWGENAIVQTLDIAPPGGE